MKTFLLLWIILVGISCSTPGGGRDPASVSNQKKYTIIFDIDWTIVYGVDQRFFGTNDVIRVRNGYYRITDYAREVISTLAARPDVQIAFFSGGEERRNLTLLETIKLNDGTGRTLLDLAGKHVYSNHHLTEAFPGARKFQNLKFSERFKKDVMVAGGQLENTLLVDDHENFSLDGQKRNLAYLGTTYNYYPSYEDSKLYGEEKYRPPTREEYDLEKAKLVWQLSIIQSALDESERKGTNLVDSYHQNHYPRNSSEAKIKIEETIKKLKAELPTKFEVEGQCRLLLKKMVSLKKVERLHVTYNTALSTF